MAKTVEIPSSHVPSWFNSYQLHVLYRGHIPGVLSGADLHEHCRKHGDRYATMRQAVREFAAQYGVTDAIVDAIPGSPRVWVAEDGHPVRIKLV